MKKLIFLIIAVLITGVLMAQNKNVYKKPAAFREGLKIGATIVSDTANKTGSYLILADSITGDNAHNPTVFKIWRKGVQLNPALTDTLSGSTVYVKLAPDTVQHTDSYTIAASDWGKDQHVLKGTSVAITFPLNLNEWPVGGIMNFYGEGAGIMVFKKATGVYFITDKDSIASSRKGQKITWKKIAANKYFGDGPLTD